MGMSRWHGHSMNCKWWPSKCMFCNILYSTVGKSIAHIYIRPKTPHQQHWAHSIQKSPSNHLYKIGWQPLKRCVMLIITSFEIERENLWRYVSLNMQANYSRNIT